LEAFIKQVVKSPCVLVGASLGGGIAINLATRNPELVKKLILIDAQVKNYYFVSVLNLQFI
jgi:pimeloyl-ACP methyl ester carboxylesterase